MMFSAVRTFLHTVAGCQSLNIAADKALSKTFFLDPISHLASWRTGGKERNNRPEIFFGLALVR